MKMWPKLVNKNGVTGEGIMWFWRFSLLIITLIVVSFVANSFSIDVRPVEAQVLAHRAPNCFTDTEIIPLSELTQDNLEDCYNFGTSGMIIKVFYGDLEKEISSAQGFYLEPICDRKESQLPYCLHSKRNVLIEEGGTIFPAYMEITTMLLN